MVSKSRSSLKRADVPSLRGEPKAVHHPARMRQQPVESRVARRSFLKGAGAVGIAAGLWTVGALPPARQALAHHGPDYRIKDRPCPSSGNIGQFYENNQACDPCGPSPIAPNACELSGHYAGYHKDSGVWGLRPGDCVPGDDFYDGWLWHVGQTCGVGGCSDFVIYRCHDGTKLIDGEESPTVCAWVCDCPGLPNDCVVD